MTILLEILIEPFLQIAFLWVGYLVGFFPVLFGSLGTIEPGPVDSAVDGGDFYRSKGMKFWHLTFVDRGKRLPTRGNGCSSGMGNSRDCRHCRLGHHSDCMYGKLESPICVLHYWPKLLEQSTFTSKPTSLAKLDASVFTGDDPIDDRCDSDLRTGRIWIVRTHPAWVFLERAWCDILNHDLDVNVGCISRV